MIIISFAGALEKTEKTMHYLPSTIGHGVGVGKRMFEMQIKTPTGVETYLCKHTCEMLATNRCMTLWEKEHGFKFNRVTNLWEKNGKVSPLPRWFATSIRNSLITGSVYTGSISKEGRIS